MDWKAKSYPCQQCVIRQIRNSTRFVSYRDIKELMADLKKIYAVVDAQTALYQLNSFDENRTKNIRRSRCPGELTGRHYPPILNIRKKSET